MNNRKLKIIYVLTSGGIGGAQRYVRDLTTALPKNEFETVTITGGKDIPSLSNRIVPFFVNDVAAIASLARAFRSFSPDIIHLNSSKAGVLGAFSAFLYNSLLRKKGTPRARVVFTAHGWVFNPANHPPYLVRVAYALLHRTAAYFQDAIVNVSGADYDIALHYRIASARKLVTIPNGIDPNMKFLDREIARKAILSKLATEKFLNSSTHELMNSTWVGSIGRLSKEKDYGTLIRAMALVPRAICIIIGNGPEFKTLKVLSGKLQVDDRLFFVSPRGDDAILLKSFDLFILPSIKEGLPYSILEAGAAGVPAIVTDAGGMPEVFKDFPASVVPMKNPEAMAARINKFLENPSLREEARHAIATSVATRYRIDAMVRETKRVYH
ncbi:MAG: glycosyltransferase [Patescibacteria group bacterium]